MLRSSGNEECAHHLAWTDHRNSYPARHFSNSLSANLAALHDTYGWDVQLPNSA